MLMTRPDNCGLDILGCKFQEQRARALPSRPSHWALRAWFFSATNGCGTIGSRGRVEVTAVLSGAGTVTSLPGLLFCRSDGKLNSGVCNVVFDEASGTLTASPAEGWAFDGWTMTRKGAASATQASGRVQTITPTANDRVEIWTATFKKLPPVGWRRSRRGRGRRGRGRRGQSRWRLSRWRRSRCRRSRWRRSRCRRSRCRRSRCRRSRCRRGRCRRSRCRRGRCRRRRGRD